MLQITSHTILHKHRAESHRGYAVGLPPELFDAMRELARVENIPLATLTVILINAGLDARLMRRSRS